MPFDYQLKPCKCHAIQRYYFSPHVVNIARYCVISRVICISLKLYPYDVELEAYNL